MLIPSFPPLGLVLSNQIKKLGQSVKLTTSLRVIPKLGTGGFYLCAIMCLQNVIFGNRDNITFILHTPHAIITMLILIFC